MSTWENLRDTVSRWTDKANAVADDLADRTATQIKLATRRADLEKEYATLGKLTYQKLCPVAPADTEVTPDNLTEQINQAMSRITAIGAEITELEKKAK